MSKVKQDFISEISVKNEKKKKKTLFVIIRCIISFEKQAAEPEHFTLCKYIFSHIYDNLVIIVQNLCLCPHLICLVVSLLSVMWS